MMIKRKMNKRGEESSPTGGIVKAVIAVVVLVIVAIALYFYFSDKAIPFARNLFGFNDTKTGVTGVEILGYSFFDGKLKYYDGNSWIDFEGKTIELNEKRIDYASTKSAFKSYFIDSRKSTSFDTTGNVYIGANKWLNRSLKIEAYFYQYVPSKIVGDTRSWLGARWDAMTAWFSTPEKHSEADIVVWPYSADLDYGPEYVLTFGNVFTYIPYSGHNISPFDGSTANKIKGEVIAWRDSIFKSPIKISYYDIDAKSSKSVYACTRILSSKGGYYLVADLGKDAGQNGVC